MKGLLLSLKGYKREYLKNDLISGVVIAAVSIPISMGYAQIAGLPAVYGLYGSLLPVLIFALFSSSPQFIFGVDAAPAAMVGSILTGMGVALGSAEAAQLVPVMSFYTALWLLLFSLLKAGKALNYISTPVMGGFISGICCTIILMQCPKLLGHGARSGELFELSVHLIECCADVHWLSLALGLAALAVLIASKKLCPKFPMAIVIMVLGAAGSYIFDLAGRGVACLAAVEPGLPRIVLPDLRLMDASQGLGASLSVAIVIMAETLLAENSFALKNDYKLNDNREIFTFSLANFASAFVGCCPTNGSVSRSAMNEQFGGKSQLVSLVAAGLMAVVLIFCTGFIQYLPVPVLTAIVISALMGAVEFDVAKKLFKADRKEFYIFIAAFLGVLVLGTIYGVIIGVVLSFADVIHRASQPKRDFLGLIPDRPGVYPLGRMSEARPIDGIVIYRFSGSLFFANIALFQKDIEDSIKADTRAVIVDASGIVSVDSTAAERMLIMYRKLKARGVKLYITEHIGEVNDELRRFGAEQLIDEGAVRRSMFSALIECGMNEELTDSLLPAGIRGDFAELLRQTQELEWAYGADAEAKLQAIAGEMLSTLENVDEREREHELEHLLHRGVWHGLVDQDGVLSFLEERLSELAKLLGHSEDAVLEDIERERERLVQHVREQRPELAKYLHEHREELEKHLKERYPEAARHIAEVREHLREESEKDE